jgi:hypothetical protein
LTQDLSGFAVLLNGKLLQLSTQIWLLPKYLPLQLSEHLYVVVLPDVTLREKVYPSIDKQLS